MHSLVILLLFISQYEGSNGHGFLSLVNVNLSNGVRSGVTCNESNTIECSSCSTLRICPQQGAEAIDITCGRGLNCVDGNCQARPCTEPFSCPAANGYFPDPFNCRQFYICNNLSPVRYTCPIGTVYKHSTASCVRQSAASPCAQVNCIGRAGTKQPYPGVKEFYALCSVNGGLLMQCEVGGFDPTTMDCGDVCTEEGNIANTNDPTSYYMCYFSGLKLIRELRQCPQNWEFDAFTNRCQQVFL